MHAQVAASFSAVQPKSSYDCSFFFFSLFLLSVINTELINLQMTLIDITTFKYKQKIPCPVQNKMSSTDFYSLHNMHMNQSS